MDWQRIQSATRRPLPLFALGLALLLTACAGDAPRGGSQVAQAEPRRGGSITMAIGEPLPNMVPIASVSSWPRIYDVYSAGLVTSDYHTPKPIGLLAERVPSLENGDISLLPDGSMRVSYRLRKGVTWHDGTPFTAQDMLFAHRFMADPDIPFGSRVLMQMITSTEAPDHYTFVLNFREPYFKADQLGVTQIWPLPRHILGPVYEAFRADGNIEVVINHAYWKTEYVHMGPFRLVSFDPSNLITLDAFDGYFLGRPKLDTIHIRVFANPEAVYASVLAGAIDVFVENTIAAPQGFELMERWSQSREGTVYVLPGSLRFVIFQWRPDYQIEPMVITDQRVRGAMYHAIDRELFAEAANGGHRETAAWEVIGPQHVWHEYIKDSMRRYAYDPRRAQALLQEAGWTPGPDGLLRHRSDGRTFQAPIRTTPEARREREAFIVQDFWQQIGLDSTADIVPPAKVRDREYRAQFRGAELSSSGGDANHTGIMRGPAARAENRWIGSRNGYENPRAEGLLDRWHTSISFDDQLRAVKAVSDFMTNELVSLVQYYNAYHIGHLSRLKALDDYAGTTLELGTFTRNAHLWELR